MSIKRWIRNWLMNEDIKVGRSETNLVEDSHEHGAQIYINEAINGRVLTIRTYRPNNPQYSNNWVTDLYVIKNDESLTEALTMLLLMKGIEK